MRTICGSADFYPYVIDEHDIFSDFETDCFDLPIDLKTIYLFTLIKKIFIDLCISCY